MSDISVTYDSKIPLIMGNHVFDVMSEKGHLGLYVVCNLLLDDKLPLSVRMSAKSFILLGTTIKLLKFVPSKGPFQVSTNGTSEKRLDF